MQANLVKAKMVEAGYNQRSLAKKLNMSENSLGQKLMGRRSFNVDEIIEMCNVLNITSNDDKANIFLS